MANKSAVPFAPGFSLNTMKLMTFSVQCALASAAKTENPLFFPLLPADWQHFVNRMRGLPTPPRLYSATPID
jgi:hypothetical protein